MDARLVTVGGPLTGKTFPVGEGELSIGRDTNNALRLNYSRVSRHHCLITREEEEFTITDLDSANGTFVNDTPVKGHVLQHGDQIKIASSLFVFLSDGEEVNLSSPVRLEERPSSESMSRLSTDDSRYLGSTDLTTVGASQDRIARDLSALLKISTTINSTESLELLHHRLLESIVEVIPVERGVILTVGEGDYRSLSRWEKNEGTDLPLALSRTIVDRVREEKTGILSNRLLTDEMFQKAESLAHSSAESILCVPLIIVDELLAIIYLETSNPEVSFSEDDLHLLTAIAGIAAPASQNARHMEWLKGENRRLQEDIDIEHSMVGESPAMREVHEFIAKAAPTGSSVLIYGESGTGKELAAHAVHQNSPRAEKPFVAINCATLTDTLLESELFGHEKGAFTGAIDQKKGKLEVADQGTLFLDEVGELAPGLQAKLLRVLQEHEIERVGGTRPIQVDIRIIAATNRNLEEALQERTFRQDLYYRLNVVSTTMPPLRDRKEDIPLLTQFFVAKFSVKCNREVVGISPEARSCLIGYDWPGNVRELQNVIERAIVLGSSDVILREDLSDALLETEPASGNPWNYHDVIKEKKKELILKAVDETNGNYTEAAKLLNLHPNYLHRLIRNLDLKAALKEK
ncbi:MAG: sigma 54-interacting transcriptional regulator [Acidobacteriota bacterium]